MIYLGQGGLHSLSASSVFGSVGLSVCLSVDNITQSYERIGFSLCCLMTPGLSKDIRCHV